LAGLHKALLDDHQVAVKTRQRSRGVDDTRSATWRGNGTSVAHLPSRLGIKRRAVKEDLQLTSVGGGKDGEHAPLCLGARVPGKDGRAELLQDLPIRAQVGVLGNLLTFPSLARLVPLALHGRRKTLNVHPRSSRLGNFARQLDRETVRVVQFERCLAT
jgi:hypothetical protein